MLLLFLSFFTLAMAQPHLRVSDVEYVRIHGLRLATAPAIQRCRPHQKLWTAKRVRRRRALSLTAMLAPMRKLGCQMGIYYIII